MVTMEGAHGTSVSRANRIRSFGWQVSTGRGGTAAYFWKKHPRFVPLAIEWYQQRKEEGVYRHDRDPACTVILADLDAEEQEILNLIGDEEFKETIDVFAQEKKLPTNTNDEISAIIDLFISEMEVDEGVIYKIVVLEVATPRKSAYPIKLIGAPICCANRTIGSGLYS